MLQLQISAEVCSNLTEGTAKQVRDIQSKPLQFELSKFLCTSLPVPAFISVEVCSNFILSEGTEKQVPDIKSSILQFECRSSFGMRQWKGYDIYWQRIHCINMSDREIGERSVQ